MMSSKAGKIYIAIALINFIVQMMDDEIKLSNWVSAIGFMGAALILYFNARKKGE